MPNKSHIPPLYDYCRLLRIILYSASSNLHIKVYKSVPYNVRLHLIILWYTVAPRDISYLVCTVYITLSCRTATYCLLVPILVCRKHQLDVCALPKGFFSHVSPAHGEYVSIVEYPHMALLGYGERDSLYYGCGGSLISEDFVLTAAHCTESRVGDPVRWALLGSTNRTVKRPELNDTYQLIEVAQVIPHDEYVPSMKYHDIALLRLAAPAKLHTDGVRPACLNTDMDKDYTGQEATATGWGATFSSGDGSESLIKVDLTVRDLQFCRDNIALNRKDSPRGLVDTQLCAGGGSHGRDTCPGDSGGPLQVHATPSAQIPCMYRILGVVSFGPLCGLGKPSVYTRVAAYVDWIERIVWPTSPDGCANIVPITGTILGWGRNPLRIPNSGPGSVARGSK
ncbi:hypothetical protein ONE63_001689 [Megalurothrips usitatus]|uniref:Peptidase S1 domain-containing protein n=1 Tax=Megalurothrips usitatus TaxID=439358 RepID=A0AAV7XA17_9NEOP|nr:hypothetical protein ONE63_001689 [Megalurothrips usitatus]